MHNLISTTLALATLIIGINASVGCEGALGGPEKIPNSVQIRVSTWHANTDSHYTGGNAADLCDCIQTVSNTYSCTLEYAFPDKKSAWGHVTFCANGKNLRSDQTTACLVTGGSGYLITAG